MRSVVPGVTPTPKDGGVAAVAKDGTKRAYARAARVHTRRQWEDMRTLYPVTGTGRVATTVTRLLKLASFPDGVDAVVVMIQVPLLRRMVQA